LLGGCAALPGEDDGVNPPRFAGAVGWSDTDTGAPVDTDTGVAADTDTGISVDTDTGISVDTDTGISVDTDTGISVDTDTGVSVDTDTGVAADTDTGSSVDTGVAPDPDTGISVDPDTGVVPDTATSVVTDTDTDTGTSLGTDTDAILDTGVAADGDTDSAVDTGGGADSSPIADPSTERDTADGDAAPDTGALVMLDTGSASWSDTGGAADTGPATETGATVDSSGTGDTGDTGDTALPSAAPIRFIALGDAGTGMVSQQQVADAAAVVCARDGCDFATYLGDNFYPSGVTDIADPQWIDKFETPYAGLAFPFYAVLGNHDYGGGGGGFDVARAQAQVDYTAVSSKWVMPDLFWSEPMGDVTFFGIDTTAFVKHSGAAQDGWYPGARAASTTTWNIALGHHPYLSNGPHGNAGLFDGMAGDGEDLATFFADHLCGEVDVYLSGHDHSLQWLEPSCGIQLLVSGGGSSGSILPGTNPTYFEDATAGFLWVELDGNTFTGVFYDRTGAELYRSSFTK